MRALKRAGDVHARASTILTASFCAAAGLTAATPPETAFDIAVSGISVHGTVNHAPSGQVQTGQPGKEYYLNCGFTATGSGGPSTVQFRFLANGQVLRDVLAPVKPGQYVGMGEFWTPASAGTYTLVCEANPSHTFQETSFANNQKSRQFTVKTLQIDPSAAMAAQGISQNQQISADVGKELTVTPDIRVQGLQVHSVVNGVPTANVVTKGNPGEAYYLHCVMEPIGPVASSSVRFLFRANGQILRDVHAPVQPGNPVHMGWKWTPSAAGTYTLVCEANPEKTFAEATYENNLKQALFPVGPAVLPKPEIEAAPGRLPAGPLGREEEEQPDEIIVCPECFNPQPEPPGFTPDPPPDDPPFNPTPPPPSEMVPIEEKAGAAPVGAPDLVPELKLQGGGVLFPLQIQVRNQGAAPALASRARVTWHLTCQKPDGTSAETFPVGPQDEVYSVPAIAPNQSYSVPGLSGPKRYCEAPPAALRKNLVCAEQCLIRARADADGLVSEGNEINNSAAAQVERK
ncbi:MAG TPA: hypothetical protein VFG78_10290 [Gemmatimonadota bacterium]|nr:hypothetical protein [Gemmatimonadota bacterium]